MLTVVRIIPTLYSIVKYNLVHTVNDELISVLRLVLQPISHMHGLHVTVILNCLLCMIRACGKQVGDQEQFIIVLMVSPEPLYESTCKDAVLFLTV